MKTIPINLKEKDIERFWKYVDVRGSSECWPWTGINKNKGYGRFYWGGKNARATTAQRISYALANEDPLGLVVCHKCDNKLCCNPAHLFAGTQGDNMRDMIAKKRSDYIGQKHEAHPQAKLNRTQVLEIREKFAGGVRKAHLAREYNVTFMTITHIVRHEQWQGIEDEAA